MTVLQFLLPWDPSFVVIAAFLLSACAFMRGTKWVRVTAGRKLLFWAGLIAFYFVLQTQFDYYAQHAFFMHRIQHAVLHHLAPFLTVMARPGAALAAGIPARWRAILKQPADWAVARAIIAFFTAPAMAVALFDGLILLWLLPAVHFTAMLDWRLYLLMNWGMAANGLMFWWLALDPASPLPPGARIAMMLAAAVPQIIMGAALCFADSALYPIYDICGRVFPGIDALVDQQIGGLILWIPGAMTSVLGSLITLHRQLGRKDVILRPVSPSGLS